MITAIYGLFDPREPYLVWYVGKGLAKRAAHHWKEFLSKGTAENARQRAWFEKLRAAGVIPGWRFLEENVVDWQKAERRLIYYWRFENPELCNVADGGNAFPQKSFGVGITTYHKLYKGTEKYVDDKVKAGKIGGPLGSKKRNELYGNPATFESCRKGGLIGGSRQTLEHLSSMGQLGAKKFHDLYPSGLGTHIRWHVNRNIVRANCKLCQEGRK
jgi:hypothetical protein